MSAPTRPDTSRVAVEKLLSRITPGEWGVEDPHPDYLSIVTNPNASTYEWAEAALVPLDEEGILPSQARANAEFIVTAAALVRALLDEREAKDVALKVAQDELWATYGDTPRLRVLFDVIESALENRLPVSKDHP